MLARLVESAPGEAAALVVGERTVSFAALAAESRRVAKGLSALGVGSGDRVAVWLPNFPAWLALLLACARLGAIAVAVNTRFRSAEVGDIVGRSRAKVLVYAPRFRRIDFSGILDGVDKAALERVSARVAVGGPAGGTLAYEELVANDGDVLERGHTDAGCLVFTTSGTTKAPKFVLHTQRSLAEHALDVADRFGWTAPETRLLQTLPYSGTFGLAQALGAFAAAAPSVVMETFDAEEAARLLPQHRITDFNGTDEMMARLLDLRADFSTVREAGYAAFDPALADIAVRGEAQGLRLFGLYGASEVQALFARRPREAALPERAWPGGKATSPNARFRVRDPESGRLLAEGDSGELEVAGPSCMKEYLDDPEATRAAFTEDGFVRIGDMAHLDATGGFFFEARMGDVLRLGGYLVAPAEIEARLQAHPGIEGAQVVGAQGPRGPAAVAFVIPRRGAAFDEAALSAWCADALARFKVPAAIIPLDAFPTTQSANGTKIQKAKLRDLAAARLKQEG